jgi:hypothetical protein
VRRNIDVGDARELLDVGPQLLRAERAVEPDGERSRVAHGIPESLRRLSESVRPEASVMVPEIISGSLKPSSSKCSSIAKSAAFAFSVSKIVSTMMMSTPPSTSAVTATLYASFTWSKLTARKPGSFTSGRASSVRFIGPQHAGDEAGLARRARRERIRRLAREARAREVHLRDDVSRP